MNGFPAPTRPGDAAFVPLAARVGAVAARHAAEHDREASFVGPAYEAMRESGYLRLAVPEKLGGLGATMRQVCYAQAELARHDGSAALAVAMHLYNTLMQAHLYGHGAAAPEGILRRIVTDDLTIATSGGSDWLWPITVAQVQPGGALLVNGRKAFCSQAPEADVLLTCAVVNPRQPDSPGKGDEVAHFWVPLSEKGVRIAETWDTLGMRGTASHDIVLDRVLVPPDAIVARRAWGEFGVPLRVAAVHFAPTAGATYTGIAAMARDLAVEQAAGRGRAPGLNAHRLVGLMDVRLRTAWWALMGSLDELGEDYTCGAAEMSTVMTAKREAVLAAMEVVDLAMDLAGGAAYFRRLPLERLYRDVRAGAFHPLTPEATLSYAGRMALDGKSESL